MNRCALKVALSTLLLSLSLTTVALASTAAPGHKHPAAPAELGALEFLIGEWDLTTSFAQADGSRRLAEARLEARWAMGGMGIAIEETHDYAEAVGGVFVNTTLYAVSPKSHRIVGASNNTLGNRKTYEVTVEAERIVIVQAGELFDGRQGFNRLVLFNISPDRYELRLDACFDSGEPCKENTYSYVAERHRQA